MTARVLVFTPDPASQRRIQLALDEHGFLVAAAGDARAARRVIELDDPAVVVVDVGGEREASFAFEHLDAGGPPLIAIVDPDDVDAADRLLARGARDVVPRGLLGSLLVHRLRALLGPGSGEQPASGGVLARWGRRRSDVLIGQSPAMTELAARIDMIAKSDIGAAIYGETGTGKELVARTIHARSRRAQGPFVVANCTALPETLFENELFGHERGAYTGADSRRPGLLDEAVGGALLLDEIGDVGGSVQAKLLRLLQFHEYKMIGGAKTLKADVRILTTTHRDLEQAVEQERFRRDLFYRMNTLRIELPPLRERLEDVPLLVDHFVSLHNERERREFEGFTPAALRLLQSYVWPGNVRELESVVYRSLVMAGAIRLLDARHVQLGKPTVESVDLDQPFAEQRRAMVERFERSYLEALLARTNGNLSRAARDAKHERKSLWRMMLKYGIDPNTYRSDG